MFLIILVVFLLQDKTVNNLMIKNLTSDEITITKIFVDEIQILNSKIKIPPELIEKQSKAYARMEMSSPKMVHITLDTNVEASKEMECKLPNDKNLKGCLFIVHITTNELNCVCDSYNDFNN